MTSEYRSMRAELHAHVVELLDALRNPLKQLELLYLLGEADILNPVHVTPETAARMVRPYTWFLDRVGSEGVKLTSAGYLPPPDVEAAVAELGLAEEWYGKFNRESQTLPVLHLREDWQARRAAADTHLALIRLGALVKDWHKLSDPEHPTQDGAKFARAALRTWPA